MSFGYVVAQITVTDADTYKKYISLVQPTIDHYGGEFLARGGKSVSYEGDPVGDRNVVIKFPSFEAAYNWYHSDEYAHAKSIRMSASTSVQTIIEGI